jgi:chitodextrinase
MRPFASYWSMARAGCSLRHVVLGALLVACTVATATTVDYTYDQYGQLTKSKTNNGTTRTNVTYTYDSAGNRTGVASSVDDLAAPSVPTGLAAAVQSATRINLTWNASTDTGGSGLAGYKIYRGGTQIGTSATPSYSDTTVTGSNSYTYKVASYDNAGNTSAQSTGVNASTPDITPPSVPTGLTATPASSTRVNLSWNASTDTGGSGGVAGYRIYRGGTQIGTSTTTSYSDTTTSGTTTYTYKVAAYDRATPANVSAQSTGVNATTPDTIAPSVPTNPAATAASATQINLTWTASTDTGGSGMSGYKIYRAGTQIGTSATTSYSDTTVAGNQTYSYKIAAYDHSNNTSAQSTAASATTPPAQDLTPPSVPTGLTATAVSSTQVNLSWSASTDNSGGSGMAGYKIYRGGTQIGTSATTSYSDTTTSGTTTYSYTVAAYDNSNNTSAQSTAAGATTPDTIAPSVPTGLSASAVSSTQVNLSWTASTDTGGSGLAGYKIYRAGSQIGTSSTASYSDTTTSGTTSYSYTVAAYDNSSNISAQSTAAGTTTPDTIAPSVPTGLSASAPSSTQVNLSWAGSSDSGGSGLAGYVIYRGGVQIGTSGTTSFSDTTVSGSTFYSYSVAAYDYAGNTSSQSIAVGVTTPDTIAPSVPTGLSASAISPTQVNLAWNASSDSGGSGLAGYYIYRNGGYLGATSATSYADTSVSGGTSYTYTVVAYDNANNPSGQSAGAGVTTPYAWISITDDTGAVLAASQGRYSWSQTCGYGATGIPYCTYMLGKSGGGTVWTYTLDYLQGGACSYGSGPAGYRVVGSCTIQAQQNVY